MAEESNVAGQPGQAGQQTAGDAQFRRTSGSAGAPTEVGTKSKQDAQEMVSRAELDKVIGERQAAKERVRGIEQQLAELQSNAKLQIDDEQFKIFQDWEVNREQADRDKAIKTGNVEAIESRIREPLQKQIEALQAHNGARKGQLTALLKTQALKVAATAANAVSPDQVVGLLQHRVRMIEDAATGQFRPEYFDADDQPMYDGDGQRIADADTFVRGFLALPDNSNLVRAITPPGSGARPTGGPRGSRGSPQTLEQFNALPDEERKRAAAEMTPQQMEESLGIERSGTGGYL